MQTRLQYIEKAPLPCPAPVREDTDRSLFSFLLGPAAWRRLAPAVRARFSHRLEPHESITYQGVIVETRMKPSGWLLAQLARIAGAPLPLDRGNGGTAAVVTVTEMPHDRLGRGGQFWTRVYGRAGAFPQIIRSVKRFAGPTGLEEQVCGGLAMALTLRADKRRLIFTSAGFYLTLGHWRLKLPRFLAPGRLTVVHEDLSHGWFSFTLTIHHPLAGELLYQKSVFTDPDPETPMEARHG